MEEKLKTTFSINDFKSEWITQKIDKHAIHFMEGLGILICDRKVKYDAQTEQYAPIDERVGYNALTASQIRNIFGEVKRIEAKIAQSNGNPSQQEEDNKQDWFTDFLLLKPKLAYTMARVTNKQRDSKIKDFHTVMVQAYKAVRSDEKERGNDFKRFSQFFEGVLAYHKAYGGKE